MSGNGEFSVQLPDGAQFTYRSGKSKSATAAEAKPASDTKAQQGPGRTATQVEDLRTQLQAAHKRDSITLLPNTSDVDRGVDPDRFAKNIEELGYDDFFTPFSNQELETVLKSVEKLGQTGVDESDPGNTFAHEVFDLFAAAIKAKQADDLSSDDFQGSTLARKITQVFSKEFLGDLEKLRAKLINDPEYRNSATNLLAYLHKVANYQAPNEADKPF